jgi:4-hydroxy-tetrahydrodipicolinate synthase
LSELDCRGVFADLVTPLKETGEVDEAALRHLVDFCCDQRFSATVVLSSIGEYPYLGEAEKISVMRIAAEQAAGRIPVVAGVSAHGTGLAVALAREARAAGCEAVLAELPHYYVLETEDVLRHLSVLCNEAGLPLVFNYIPDTSRLVLTPEQISKVAELDGVEAVVLTLVSISFVTEVIELTRAKGVPVLAGTSFLFKESLEAGASGLCCPLPVLGPADVKGIWEAHRAGDGKRCKELQDKVLSLLSFYTHVVSGEIDTAEVFRGMSSRPAPTSPRRARPVYAIIKEALRLQGHPLTAMVKSPYQPASPEHSWIASTVLKYVGWEGPFSK